MIQQQENNEIMKQSTKASIEFKMIKWFRKLFNYTPYIQPYIVEERKIQRIKSEHIFSPFEEEYLKTKEDEIINHVKSELSINIAKVMLNIGAINFEINQNMGNTKITATTFVPEKL